MAKQQNKIKNKRSAGISQRRLSKNIDSVLAKQKISRKELADLLVETKGSVSQILNFDRDITLCKLDELANVLNVNAWDLIKP